MSYDFKGFVQEGWMCPICKRIYSPTTPMCWYCGGEQKTVVSTGTQPLKEFVNSWTGERYPLKENKDE